MREAFSTWKRLRADRNGVVSFEYVIVAGAIVTATAAIFSTDAGDTIKTTLTTAIGAIIAAFTAAVAG